MPKRKSAFDTLSDEQRRLCLDKIIAHFLDERGEQIGVIGAEQLLDITQEIVATSAYNRAIADSLELVQAKSSDMQVELDILKKK